MNAASKSNEIVHTAVNKANRASRAGFDVRNPREGRNAPAATPTTIARATATADAIVTLELIRRTAFADCSGRNRTREMLKPRVERIAREVPLVIRTAPRPRSTSENIRPATAQNPRPRSAPTASVAMRYNAFRTTGVASRSRQPRRAPPRSCNRRGRGPAIPREATPCMSTNGHLPPAQAVPAEPRRHRRRIDPSIRQPQPPLSHRTGEPRVRVQAGPRHRGPEDPEGGAPADPGGGVAGALCP